MNINNEEKANVKGRVIALAAALLATVVTAFAAFKLGIDPPMGNVVGGFAALLAGVVIAAVFKLPDGMYYMILVFVYFAEPVGSVLNLYRTWGPYDKIVHFFSGILIAACGMIIMWKLFDRNRVDASQRGKLLGPSVLAAVFAAGAAAGIWEIIEFAIDILISGEMQRGMVDTITDMIAGNLGGMLYGCYIYIKYRRYK